MRPYRGGVPPVAKIEPLTTARTLRGPFDYLRPDGVGIGALLEVPFAGRTLRGVVTGLADSSEHELAAPRRVLEQSLPPDLVELALWMAAEFCSTPARALALVAPAADARAKTALWAESAEQTDEDRAADRPPASAARVAAALHRCRHGGAAPPGGARPGADSTAHRQAGAGACPGRRAPRDGAAADGRAAGRARCDLRRACGACGRARPVGLAAARRHRLRQDRGLPARRRRGARAGWQRDRARARDRADAADRLALRRPLWRHRRRSALQARRGRATRRVDAAADAERHGSRSARALRCSRRSSGSAS